MQGGLRRSAATSAPGRPVRRSRRQLEADFQHRARVWAGTSILTWSIWAMTGAHVTPEVVITHSHAAASAGMWPALVMVCGLGDLAKRASRLYGQH